MRLFQRVLPVVVALSLVGVQASAEKKISVSVLKDKLMGGWVGQGVGVSYGAPTEFTSCGRTLEKEIPQWQPANLAGSLSQDDLYVDMTFISALETFGPDITYQQAGEAFGATLYRLWHANEAGRSNIKKGIMPPLSGNPRYNIHADDIDFQIEADGLGLVCPGLPRVSNDLCEVFGHVMNYGDGVYGGMWVAAMYTQAFFESDPKVIVTQALKAVPAESGFARCISDVVKWHGMYPNDWKKTWAEIEKKYQDNIDCAPGRAFNIDAKLNAAYIAVGLLYGNGDMARTMELATRCGQDSDCNPSNACGVLGCSVGLSKIEEKYKSHLPQLAGQKFQHTNYSYDTVTDACVSIARKVVEKAGGKIVRENGEEYFIIPDQTPLPPSTLEQWTDEAQKREIAGS